MNGNEYSELRPIDSSEPQKKSSKGIWIAILSIFLAVSLVANLVLLLATIVAASLNVEIADVGQKYNYVEETIRAGKPGGKKKIVSIPVAGIITSGAFWGSSESMVDMVGKQLEVARRDGDVKGVLLHVNSPGGEVTASDTILHKIQSFQKSNKPVVVFMDGMAASGGYYVSASADEIVAHPTVTTGSIGVLLSWYNMENLFQKLGLQNITIKSEHTPMKDFMSGLRPLRVEEREMLEKHVEGVYSRFIKIVSDNRGLELEKVREEIADGRIFTAEQAKEVGLVDSIGYFEDAVSAVEKQAGITNAKVVRYVKRPGLADVLFSGGSASLGKGATVQIDFSTLAMPRTPQFLYLWAPDLSVLEQR